MMLVVSLTRFLIHMNKNKKISYSQQLNKNMFCFVTLPDYPEHVNQHCTRTSVRQALSNHLYISFESQALDDQPIISVFSNTNIYSDRMRLIKRELQQKNIRKSIIIKSFTFTASF